MPFDDYVLDPVTGQWHAPGEIGTTATTIDPSIGATEFASPQGGPVAVRGGYGPSPASGGPLAGHPAATNLVPSSTRTTSTPSSSLGTPWSIVNAMKTAGRYIPSALVDNPWALGAGIAMTPTATASNDTLDEYYRTHPNVPVPNYDSTRTTTQTGVGKGPATPIPPQAGPGGPNPNFPPNAPIIPRAAIPPFPPHVPSPRAQVPPAAGPPAAGPPGALSAPAAAVAAAPSPGEYFATTGNARTPVWQPGGFASPPAPHFQTPLTPMYGPGQWLNPQQPLAVGASSAAAQVPSSPWDPQGAGYAAAQRMGGRGGGGPTPYPNLQDLHPGMSVMGWGNGPQPQGRGVGPGTQMPPPVPIPSYAQNARDPSTANPRNPNAPFGSFGQGP